MPKNVLPDAARVLPKAGQQVWLKAFNEALDRGLPEDEASKMAWAAVKKAGYSKSADGKKWSKSMNPTEITFNDDGTFDIGVPLMKVDAAKRIVEGFATLNNVDQVNDQVDSDASLEAFGDWIGNVREMHQKIAVGKAVDWYPETINYEGIDYDGIWVRAKISKGAEDTWQKVLDGTLAGFSIGGATLAKERALVKDADGSQKQIWKITKYKLTELSLVDNPCNRLATISLVKSVDGGVEVDDTIADGELDKAYNGETNEFVSFEHEYRGVISALESLRDRGIAEKADYIVAEASEKLACFRSKARWEAQDADYHDGVTKSEDNKEAEMAQELEKSEESSQENENSDTSITELLTEEDKSVFRKFVDFIKGEETPTEDEAKAEESGAENNTEEETPDMNADEVAKAIEAAGEELNKSADEKFGQVGESLVKITELLEKVATAESVDELKKEFEAKVEELAGRVEAVEKSGAVQKSGENAGDAGEKIEKSEGLWTGSILPEFAR